MYLQKVLGKTLRKIKFLLASWRSWTKRTESGSGFWSESGFGYIKFCLSFLQKNTYFYKVTLISYKTQMQYLGIKAWGGAKIFFLTFFDTLLDPYPLDSDPHLLSHKFKNPFSGCPQKVKFWKFPSNGSSRNSGAKVITKWLMLSVTRPWSPYLLVTCFLLQQNTSLLTKYFLINLTSSLVRWWHKLCNEKGKLSSCLCLKSFHLSHKW